MSKIRAMLVSAAVAAVVLSACGDDEHPLEELNTDNLSFVESSGAHYYGWWRSEEGAGINGGIAAVLSGDGFSSDEFEIEMLQESPIVGTLSFKYRPVLVSESSEASLVVEVHILCDDDTGYDVTSYYDSCKPAQVVGWKEASITIIASGGSVPDINIIGRCYPDGGCESASLVLCDFKWTPAPESIEISFDTLGGPVIAPIVAAPGDRYCDVDMPTPSMPGWTFNGWYSSWVDEYGQSQREYLFSADLYESEALIPFGGVTLYADWDKPVSVLGTSDMSFASTGNWCVRDDDGGGSYAHAKILGSDDEVGADFVPQFTTSKMTATVTGPAFVKFNIDYWQNYYGYGYNEELVREGESRLDILVDGSVKKSWEGYDSASGEEVVVAVPEGMHTISWELSGKPCLLKETEYDWKYDEDQEKWVRVDGETYYIAAGAGGAEVRNIEYAKGGATDSVAAWLRRIKDFNSWTTGDLARFAAEYTTRFEANPEDYEARIMHAALLLAQLAESETVATYAKKFGFTLDYLGMHYSGKETDPATWPAANTIVDQFMKEAVPVMKNALADLAAIPSDWTGSVLLLADEYPVDEDTAIDIGDVLYARAGLEAAIGLAYFAHGYDLTVDYAKIKAAVNYERPIPVVQSVPSMTTDDGWENALFNDKAKMLASGKDKKLYVRLTPKEIADTLWDSCEYMFIKFENIARPGVSYGLCIQRDMETSEYRAYLGDADDVKHYCWWGDKQAISRLAQPQLSFEEDLDKGVWTFSVDLGGSWTVVATDMLSVCWAAAEFRFLYASGNDEYDADYYYQDIEFSSCAATVYKILTEQTGFVSKVRNVSSLQTSKAWMKTALARALEADAAVMGRTDGAMHVIEYDMLADGETIGRARNLTEKALASLDSPVGIDVQKEVFGDRDAPFDTTLLPVGDDGLMRVYLSALFSGAITRDMLPAFQKGADEGPVPVMESIADPTLGGLLPDFTVSSWSDLVQSMGLAVAHAPVRRIMLDANGGTCPEEAKDVYVGQPVGELPSATLGGSVFQGWFTARDGGALVTEKTLMVNFDVTLYAHWGAVAAGSCFEKAIAFPFGPSVAMYPVALTREWLWDEGRYDDKSGVLYCKASIARGKVYTIALPVEQDFEVACGDEGALVEYATYGSLRFCRIDARNIASGTADLVLALFGAVGTKTTVYVSEGDLVPAAAIWEDPEYGGQPGSCPGAATALEFGEGAQAKTVKLVREWDEVGERYLDGGVHYLAAEAQADGRLTVAVPAAQADGCEVSCAGNAVVGPEDFGGVAFWIFDAKAGDDVMVRLSGERGADSSVYTFGGDFLAKKLFFDPNGGACPVSTKEVRAGQAVGELPSATLGGSAFQGWFTARDGGALVTAATVMVNSDVTLYAHWGAVAAGSCLARAVAFPFGSSVAMYPVALTREWLWDEGRYDDKSGVLYCKASIARGKVYTIALPVEQDFEVACGDEGALVEYATYGSLRFCRIDARSLSAGTSEIVLAIYGDAGSKTTVYVSEGDLVPADAEYENPPAGSCLGKAAALEFGESAIAKTVRLVPEWDEDGEQYLAGGVHYLRAAAPAYGPLTVAVPAAQADGCAVVCEGNAVVREDFGGIAFWIFDAIAGDDVVVRLEGERGEDATVYTFVGDFLAKKLFFDPTGGDCADRSKDVRAGQPVGKLPSPTLVGSVFLGWFTAREGGVRVTAETVMVNYDVTLYAHWERLALGSCQETAVPFAMTTSVAAYPVALAREWLEDELKYSDEDGALYCKTTLERGKVYTMAVPRGLGEVDAWCVGVKKRCADDAPECGDGEASVTYGSDASLQYVRFDTTKMAADETEAYFAVFGDAGQRTTIYAVEGDYMP